MSRPALNYTLQISVTDDTGRITITSDDVPGLLIWAYPQEAFSDVHESVKKLRLLNATAEMRSAGLPQAIYKRTCARCGKEGDAITPPGSGVFYCSIECAD